MLNNSLCFLPMPPNCSPSNRPVKPVITKLNELTNGAANDTSTVNNISLISKRAST